MKEDFLRASVPACLFSTCVRVLVRFMGRNVLYRQFAKGNDDNTTDSMIDQAKVVERVTVLKITRVALL